MIWPAFQLKKEPAMPEIVLEGKRLYARPPQAMDFSEWVRVRKKNRAYLEPFEPTWPDNCLSREFFDKRMVQQAKDWRQGRCHSFLIFDKKHRLIGGININNVCRGAAHFASLGYWIDEAHQGKGYMKEALKLVIGFGFDELRLHRFNAGCISENVRSGMLLKNLGFREEGFAKRYLKINGMWQDHVLFGINVDEWEDA